VTIPEGLVVLRESKQQVNPNEKTTTVRAIAPNGQLRYVQEPGYNRGLLASGEREPYLVHGNCIYRIGRGWDEHRHELRPEYQKYLTNAALSPDFCFPLQIGSKWGNNDIPWRVAPARQGVDSFLPRRYSGAIHFVSDHFGSGGLKDVWFQKGVGVVGEHYLHNGTFDEFTTKLVSFVR
jgi:hypothetical protein